MARSSEKSGGAGFYGRRTTSFAGPGVVQWDAFDGETELPAGSYALLVIASMPNQLGSTTVTVLGQTVTVPNNADYRVVIESVIQLASPQAPQVSVAGSASSPKLDRVTVMVTPVGT